MPDNSATKPAPAQDTRSRQHSPAPRKRRGFAVIAGLALLAIIGLLCWSAFEYYAIMTTKDASGATAAEIPRRAQLFRDIIILCLAAIGIGMAFWRNASLDRQSKAANKQADNAANQFALANERLYSDQFANAAELMSKENKDGKPAIAARTSGIYVMADLAMKLPAAFAERVVINLIAYIKENARKTATPELPKGEKPAKPRKLGGDVKAAFSVLSDILGNKAARKHIADKLLDFSQANFSGLDFWKAGYLRHYKHWTEVSFKGCHLGDVRFADGADMRRANFSGAVLVDAVMKGANLSWADMRGANLGIADLQGCYIRHAKLQQADDGKNTDMSGTKLAGANLTEVSPDGADMNAADIRGAAFYNDTDLTGVKTLPHADFGETYMIGAKIDESVKRELSEKAEHMGRKIWLDYDECSDGTNWHLEEYEDGYALAGVLINFAGAPFLENTKDMNFSPLKPGYFHLDGEPKNIQRQAAKLEQVPENTPDSIKEWLKDIRAKYSGR